MGVHVGRLRALDVTAVADRCKTGGERADSRIGAAWCRVQDRKFFGGVCIWNLAPRGEECDTVQ
jgi:hypothetical protein